MKNAEIRNAECGMQNAELKTHHSKLVTQNSPPSFLPHPSSFSSPWVKLKTVRWGPLQFVSSVDSASPDARAGDLVNVYGPEREYVGRGLFNPQSNYAVRILTRKDESVDAAWFEAQLVRAVELRRKVLKLDATTNAYRLVHAEGDGLSGLIADKLGDVLSVEVFSLGIWRRMEWIVPVLMQLADCQQVQVGVDERIRRAEGITGVGRWGVEGGENTETPKRQNTKMKNAECGTQNSPLPPSPVLVENGVRFRVRFGAGQGGHKTGFFCDQRDNRKRWATLVEGQSVLDVCCYTGGFACYAKKLGHAEEVTAVDLDEKALAIARENVNLNQLRVNLIHADAYSYLRQMQTNGRKFGAVVLDPSKFVSSPAEMREGRQKYIDLNKLGVSVLQPGGLLLSCSCSGLVSREDFVRIVCDAGRYMERKVQLLDVTGAGADHPVMADFPEGAYLKAVWARVW